MDKRVVTLTVTFTREEIIAAFIADLDREAEAETDPFTPATLFTESDFLSDDD